MVHLHCVFANGCSAMSSSKKVDELSQNLTRFVPAGDPVVYFTDTFSHEFRKAMVVFTFTAAYRKYNGTHSKAVVLQVGEGDVALRKNNIDCPLDGWVFSILGILSSLFCRIIGSFRKVILVLIGS